jgi:predicted nucleotidyltransferase
MSSRDPESPTELHALKRRLRAELPRLREKYAVERLALHGSRLRGEAHPDSDLDILVDFENSEAGRSISLFDFLALQYELEDLLGISVDLGEASALQGPAAEDIRREAEYV